MAVKEGEEYINRNDDDDPFVPEAGAKALAEAAIKETRAAVVVFMLMSLVVLAERMSVVVVVKDLFL